jgi:hypothetical protein
MVTMSRYNRVLSGVNQFKWVIVLLVVVIAYGANYFCTIPTLEWTGHSIERTGFLFGSSETIQSNKSQILIQLQSLDIENREANVNVIAYPFVAS